MRFRILPSLGLSIGTCAVLMAVQAQTGNAKPKSTAAPIVEASDKPTKGGVIVNGKSTIWDSNTGIAQLTKDVTVTQVGEDFILYAQKLTYNKNLNRAIASENLKVETRNSTIHGDQILADFDDKTLTLTGNVTITSHGKGDGITGNLSPTKSDNGNKPKSSVINCDRVEWDYETHQATITGNIRLTSGQDHGTCLKIVYDENQNVADLTGDVRFSNVDGQTFTTTFYRMFMDDNVSQSPEGGTIVIPVDQNKGAKPRLKKTPIPPKTVPRIPHGDEDLFHLTPQPEPTQAPASPEPTGGPAPTAAPTEAPKS